MNDLATISGELMVDSAVRELVAAEIDTQIATAKQFPREIAAFKKNCSALACLDEETAASMIYAVKRGSKIIEGPSVRMAEIIAYSWKNIRTDARIISIDSKFTTAQATCMDLENNIAARKETKRRITYKDGSTFNDDMIQVTSNAAMAIALREAVFSVVPRSLWFSIYEAAKKVAMGDAGKFESSRQSMLEWFAKAGAGEELVFAFLNVKSVDEIRQDDLTLLRGVATRMKDEGVSAQDALSVNEPEGKHVSAAKRKRTSKAKEKEIPEHKPEPKKEPVETDFDALLAQATAMFGKAETEDDINAIQMSFNHDELKMDIGILADEARKRIAK